MNAHAFLSSLRIENFVLVERLNLSLKPGFTVLTGETGAGKSILLDALALCLGERADSSQIREGADRALVEAEFVLGADRPLHKVLEEANFPSSLTLTLRRILTRDGRSRLFLNDQPTSLTFLKSLNIVDIHGQFDNLLNPGSHRILLDAFGGAFPLSERVEKNWKIWRGIEDRLQKKEVLLLEIKKEEELKEHYLQELATLNPLKGEEGELLEKRTLLQKHLRSQEHLEEAQNLLSGEGGLALQLHLLIKKLSRSEDLPESLLTTLAHAEEAIEEASREVDLLALREENPAAKLEKIEDRLFSLRDLARKHRVQPDDLPEVLKDLQNHTIQTQVLETEVAELRLSSLQAKEAYRKEADALSTLRVEMGQELQEAVHPYLTPLKLERARLEVHLSPIEGGPKGQEDVEFFIAPNGGKAGPLGKIASGGELSRILLALKRVLALQGKTQDKEPLVTVVFDEIDAAVGGAQAAAMGHQLRDLSEHFQVLSITHSPQIAAMGDTHLKIMKSDEIPPTASVLVLDEEGRHQEIARMLSGEKISAEALGAARSLREGIKV